MGELHTSHALQQHTNIPFSVPEEIVSIGLVKIIPSRSQISSYTTPKSEMPTNTWQALRCTFPCLRWAQAQRAASLANVR